MSHTSDTTIMRVEAAESSRKEHAVLQYIRRGYVAHGNIITRRRYLHLLFIRCQTILQYESSV